MMKRDVMIRSGAAAIAALALSSTQAPAQDTAAEPAVTAEEMPVTTGAPAEQSAPPDELAPLAEPEPESAASATEASEPAPAAAAKPARAHARANAPRLAPSDAFPRSDSPAAEASVAGPDTVVREELSAPVAAAAPPEAAGAQTSPIGPVGEEVGFGLGAAALLGLGVGAVAITRRRRRFDEDEEPVDSYEAEPEAQAHLEPGPAHPARFDPAIIAPAFAGYAGGRSVFAWGGSGRFETRMPDSAPTSRPGETHVERAMRGPTPDNPSLSIRKRLKRAAFFDKRAREIAQGKGRPVDRYAGLPAAAAAAPATAPTMTRATPRRVLEQA